MQLKFLVHSLYLISLLTPWIAAPLSASEAPQFTPVVLQVLDAPLQTAQGSDGDYHLAYEVQLTNVSPQNWRVEQVKVVSNDKQLMELSGKDLQSRMGSMAKRGGSTELGPNQTAFLWIHLKFRDKNNFPENIQHQITLGGAGKPLLIQGAKAEVISANTLTIAAPLQGGNWLAGDGCCDSIRHVRALLPINGHLYSAQRFAIDWEMLDENHRIYSGDAKNPENYFCYGKNVLAVSDAEVFATTDGLPNQVPGKLPDSIDISQADGNFIILTIAPYHYALYAHLKPGSIRVKKGDQVLKGQILAQVGNSGNTSEPHLHFHIMDGPTPLASNGLPYQIQSFDILGKAKSTEAFDKAAADGTPLAIEAVKGPLTHQDQLPLDLSLVRFP